MTGIVDSPPAADEIDWFLGRVQDERFDDPLWVDLEFDAIIAANWDTEPPDPPEPPTGLPARWHRTGRTARSEPPQRSADQVMAGDHRRRQRSPPHRS
jgi:hypothetical protein